MSQAMEPGIVSIKQEQSESRIGEKGISYKETTSFLQEVFTGLEENDGMMSPSTCHPNHSTTQLPTYNPDVTTQPLPAPLSQDNHPGKQLASQYPANVDNTSASQSKSTVKGKGKIGIKNYGRFKCSLCDRYLSTNHALTNHLRTHTEEKPYVCSFCGRGFSQPAYLRQHCMLHTGERPYTCDHCGQGFIDVRTRDRHVMTHTGYRPYTCQDCGKGFKEQHKLRRHINRYHEETPQFQCKTCGAVCGDKWDLKLHEQKHQKTTHATLETMASRRHLCQFCDTHFATNASLVRHSRRKHPAPEDVAVAAASKLIYYECSQCEKSFKYKWDLKHHVKLHTDPEAFKCPHCQRLFSAPNSLAAHQKRCFLTNTKTKCEEEESSLKEVDCITSNQTVIPLGGCVGDGGLSDGYKDALQINSSELPAQEYLSTRVIGDIIIPKSATLSAIKSKDSKFEVGLDVNFNMLYFDSTTCDDCVYGFLDVDMLESHIICHRVKEEEDFT